MAEPKTSRRVARCMNESPRVCDESKVSKSMGSELRKKVSGGDILRRTKLLVKNGLNFNTGKAWDSELKKK